MNVRLRAITGSPSGVVRSLIFASMRAVTTRASTCSSMVPSASALSLPSEAMTRTSSAAVATEITFASPIAMRHGAPSETTWSFTSEMRLDSNEPAGSSSTARLVKTVIAGVLMPEFRRGLRARPRAAADCVQYVLPAARHPMVQRNDVRRSAAPIGCRERSRCRCGANRI